MEKQYVSTMATSSSSRLSIDLELLLGDRCSPSYARAPWEIGSALDTYDESWMQLRVGIRCDDVFDFLLNRCVYYGKRHEAKSTYDLWLLKVFILHTIDVQMRDLIHDVRKSNLPRTSSRYKALAPTHRTYFRVSAIHLHKFKAEHFICACIGAARAELAKLDDSDLKRSMQSCMDKNFPEFAEDTLLESARTASSFQPFWVNFYGDKGITNKTKKKIAYFKSIFSVPKGGLGFTQQCLQEDTSLLVGRGKEKSLFFSAVHEDDGGVVELIKNVFRHSIQLKKEPLVLKDDIGFAQAYVPAARTAARSMQDDIIDPRTILGDAEGQKMFPTEKFRFLRTVRRSMLFSAKDVLRKKARRDNFYTLTKKSWFQGPSATRFPVPAPTPSDPEPGLTPEEIARRRRRRRFEYMRARRARRRGGQRGRSSVEPSPEVLEAQRRARARRRRLLDEARERQRGRSSPDGPGRGESKDDPEIPEIDPNVTPEQQFETFLKDELRKDLVDRMQDIIDTVRKYRTQRDELSDKKMLKKLEKRYAVKTKHRKLKYIEMLNQSFKKIQDKCNAELPESWRKNIKNRKSLERVQELLRRSLESWAENPLLNVSPDDFKNTQMAQNISRALRAIIPWATAAGIALLTNQLLMPALNTAGDFFAEGGSMIAGGYKEMSWWSSLFSSNSGMAFAGTTAGIGALGILLCGGSVANLLAYLSTLLAGATAGTNALGTGVRGAASIVKTGVAVGTFLFWMCRKLYQFVVGDEMIEFLADVWNLSFGQLHEELRGESGAVKKFIQNAAFSTILSTIMYSLIRFSALGTYVSAMNDILRQVTFRGAQAAVGASGFATILALHKPYRDMMLQQMLSVGGKFTKKRPNKLDAYGNPVLDQATRKEAEEMLEDLEEQIITMVDDAFVQDLRARGVNTRSDMGILRNKQRIVMVGTMSLAILFSYRNKMDESNIAESLRLAGGGTPDQTGAFEQFLNLPYSITINPVNIPSMFTFDAAADGLRQVLEHFGMLNKGRSATLADFAQNGQGLRLEVVKSIAEKFRENPQALRNDLQKLLFEDRVQIQALLLVSSSGAIHAMLLQDQRRDFGLDNSTVSRSDARRGSSNDIVLNRMIGTFPESPFGSSNPSQRALCFDNELCTRDHVPMFSEAWYWNVVNVMLARNSIITQTLNISNVKDAALDTQSVWVEAYLDGEINMVMMSSVFAAHYSHPDTHHLPVTFPVNSEQATSLLPELMQCMQDSSANPDQRGATLAVCRMTYGALHGRDNIQSQYSSGIVVAPTFWDNFWHYFDSTFGIQREDSQITSYVVCERIQMMLDVSNDVPYIAHDFQDDFTDETPREVVLFSWVFDKLRSWFEPTHATEAQLVLDFVGESKGNNLVRDIIAPDPNEDVLNLTKYILPATRKNAQQVLHYFLKCTVDDDENSKAKLLDSIKDLGVAVEGTAMKDNVAQAEDFVVNYLPDPSAFGVSGPPGAMTVYGTMDGYVPYQLVGKMLHSLALQLPLTIDSAVLIIEMGGVQNIVPKLPEDRTMWINERALHVYTYPGGDSAGVVGPLNEAFKRHASRDGVQRYEEQAQKNGVGAPRNALKFDDVLKNLIDNSVMGSVSADQYQRIRKLLTLQRWNGTDWREQPLLKYYGTTPSESGNMTIPEFRAEVQKDFGAVLALAQVLKSEKVMKIFRHSYSDVDFQERSRLVVVSAANFAVDRQKVASVVTMCGMYRQALINRTLSPSTELQLEGPAKEAFKAFQSYTETHNHLPSKVENDLWRQSRPGLEKIVRDITALPGDLDAARGAEGLPKAESTALNILEVGANVARRNEAESSGDFAVRILTRGAGIAGAVLEVGALAAINPFLAAVGGWSTLLGTLQITQQRKPQVTVEILDKNEAGDVLTGGGELEERESEEPEPSSSLSKTPLSHLVNMVYEDAVHSDEVERFIGVGGEERKTMLARLRRIKMDQTYRHERSSDGREERLKVGIDEQLSEWYNETTSPDNMARYVKMLLVARNTADYAGDLLVQFDLFGDATTASENSVWRGVLQDKFHFSESDVDEWFGKWENQSFADSLIEETKFVENVDKHLRKVMWSEKLNQPVFEVPLMHPILEAHVRKIANTLPTEAGNPDRIPQYVIQACRNATTNGTLDKLKAQHFEVHLPTQLLYDSLVDDLRGNVLVLKENKTFLGHLLSKILPLGEDESDKSSILDVSREEIKSIGGDKRLELLSNVLRCRYAARHNESINTSDFNAEDEILWETIVRKLNKINYEAVQQLEEMCGSAAGSIWGWHEVHLQPEKTERKISTTPMAFPEPSTGALQESETPHANVITQAPPQTSLRF